MNQDSKINRRELLVAATCVGGAIPLASTLFGRNAFAAGACSATQKEVDSANPVAKALKYYPDATKATERKAEKTGVAAKDQKCSNCQLYKAECGAGAKELGKCSMITAGLVHSGGWCNSWMKKA